MVLKMLAFMCAGEPPELRKLDELVGLLGAAARYEIDALRV
jgi:hypothetical protein